MKEHIAKILDDYYDSNRPDIRDLRVLGESPKLGIVCIRWRDEMGTHTVKSILQENQLIITELR